MANLNIKFNNKTYSIDPTSLADATARLEAHLMGMMEERLDGDGAEFYTLAPTALSFRSTAPLNELQSVQINGVTVDPSNYTLEEGSTIVTFPIEYLKTLDVGSYEVAVASDSKTVKGDFSVVQPELNEYGFYYNQPYTAYIEAFLGNCIFFFRKDGTMDFINGDGSVEICSYTYSNDSIIVYTSLGTFNGSVSAGGTEVYCIELNITFKLGDNSIVADKDYIYTYDDSLGGYVVNAIDKTSASYDTIRTGIYNMPTVKLSERMFANHDANADWAEIETVLVTAPIIPNSVIIIGDCAFLRRTGFSSITLPENLAFIGWKAFEGCYDLTDITFEGTISQWNAINKLDDWNYGVPATYVQCSDGQVAL